MSPQSDAGSHATHYIAPLDGSRCLRIEGRLRRLKLPLPAEPPEDVPPAGCFLCHPERDPFDLGPWPLPQGQQQQQDRGLRLLGNAHGFADRTLLLAPADEAMHAATPATLPLPLLEQLLRAPFDQAFHAHAGTAELDVVAFFNVGRAAAQSRRHPHLQVVGFRRERELGAVGDADAVAADLAVAAAEGRNVDLGVGATAVVPREPGMTAELWIPAPTEGAPVRAWEEFARSAQQAASVCERMLSGCYNLLLHRRPARLARIVPRGLSERAGLELAAPGVVGSVIAASVRETLLLWTARPPAAPPSPPH